MAERLPLPMPLGLAFGMELVEMIPWVDRE